MTVRWGRILCAAFLVAAGLAGGPLRAQEKSSDDIPEGRGPFPPGPLRDLDTALKPYGIRPSFSYTGEVLGNAAGGMRQGAIYDGRVDLGIDADLEKLIGWSGAKFHANAFNNHGDGLSREYVDNLMTVSSIESLNHTRLYEFWIEQAFGKNFSLRFGKIAADDEFDTSQYANFFVNSTFGWPAISGINLPGGGPADPLTVMGVRAKATLSDELTLLFAMFDGNGPGPGNDDPENLDPHGLKFRVSDSPLLMAELQYGYKLGTSHPGKLKLGAWVHTGSFDDQRYDTLGLSLADPASNGMPAQHRGDFGPYAVFEQMLVPFDKEGQKGIAVYGRVQASPSDRNQINFYVDGGINVTGFWDARPDDGFAIGFAYAGISPSARGFDQDSVNFGTPTAVRNYEALIEVAYSAQIKRGWTLQPDFQYVIHPGAGASNPLLPANTQPMANALVFGLRTTVQWGYRDPDSFQ
jgi:porin